MPDPITPAAIVQPAIQQAIDLIQEAKAIDATMKADIRRCCTDMVRRGELLIRAQKIVGKGEPWRLFLAKYWTDRTVRTAYRYMRQATDKASSDMVSQFESHTHRMLDGEGADEESPDDDLPPLTEKQRKIMYLLIAVTRPKLAKKLRSGKKLVTDAELRKLVPPSCDKCSRFGPPSRPCDICTRLRKDSLIEPEDEGDSGSPNKVVDPYKKARNAVANTARLLTDLVADDGDLLRAFSACGLMDHTGGTPKFLPLAGVARVITEVTRGLTDEEKIKTAYREACGTWLPEKTRYWREKRRPK